MDKDQGEKKITREQGTTTRRDALFNGGEEIQEDKDEISTEKRIIPTKSNPGGGPGDYSDFTKTSERSYRRRETRITPKAVERYEHEKARYNGDKTQRPKRKRYRNAHSVYHVWSNHTLGRLSSWGNIRRT